MTNHPAKTPRSVSIPQGDCVVSNPDQGPVCLDTVPGAHKDFAKSKVLLDVLVEGFDPDPLEVKLNHLRLGHFEIVGDKKADAVFGLGDKQQDGSDLGQMDKELGHAKPSFFGSPNGFVLSGPLGQAAERSFLSIDFDDAVSFGSRKENPSSLNNKIENRGAGIPGIHQDGELDRKSLNRFGKDFDGNLDFAFESPPRRSLFGPVATDGPNKTLGSDFENTGDGTKATDKTVGSVMNARTFDFLAVPRTRGIVDNQKRLLRSLRFYNLALIFALKSLDFLGRGCQKLVKAVDVGVSKLGSDFPDGAKLHQKEQAGQIDRKIFPLGFAQDSQEIRKIRRNLFGWFLAHGFRVLLALVGIGDFGRKPFCLKCLSSWVT